MKLRLSIGGTSETHCIKKSRSLQGSFFCVEYVAMASEEVEGATLDRSGSMSTEKPSMPDDILAGETVATSITASQSPVTPADRLKSFTDVALKFIGNASNETLGACAVGLAASTYLVLGRIGLVLIGAFGGVVLSVTWDLTGASGKSDEKEQASRRRELGIEVAKRALDFRSQKQNHDGLSVQEDKVEASTARKILDFSEYPAATASALTDFTNAVIQDYVKFWYAPILPAEESFPTDCRQILVAFIHSLSNHVSRKRAADPFLDFLANSTSVVIVFLQELAVALKASQRAEAADALRAYLEYEPNSNLANVLNKTQQNKKLHMVADDILQSFLDSKTYNCLPARTFLQEVLAGLILNGTLNSCSKAEWINGWIVYLLEDGEPSLLDAIDAGVSELEERAKETGAPVEDVARRAQHKRRVSRAEQAMEEAMLEAQRMNEMIAEEEARRKQGPTAFDSEDALSTTATTDTGIATPTSSEDEPQTRPRRAISNSMVFDSEGNAIPSLTPSPAKPSKKQQNFTSFDQLEQVQSPPTPQPTSEAPARTEAMLAIPLTLLSASINIIDLGASDPQRPMKQKPESDLMIQIEPASSRFPGWIVTRQYASFEPLHETLRRIANISGVQEFNLQFPDLPPWKNIGRQTMIDLLEQYLKTALKHERLAESEAMKRFLEKETGLDKISSSQKNVFVQAGAGLENVGKGFVNVLGQGGKGLQTGFTAGGKVFQTGGKAVLGGVTGVFGTVAGGIGGPKRPGLSSNNSSASVTRVQDNIRQSPRQSSDLLRQNADPVSQSTPLGAQSSSTRSSTDQTNVAKESSAPSVNTLSAAENLNLPPPPDMMTDDFQPTSAMSPRSSTAKLNSRPTTPTISLRHSGTDPSPSKAVPTTPAPLTSSPQKKSARPQDTFITEEETRMTVDLMFALITELLSLSSAWTFRLSLLTAAKSYLLRPNNPQLKSIRTLLQESVVDANVSDEGLATHIRKIRENGLPTEEELKKWPKEPTDEEKERLRIKARKLLVERGMPQALTTVVGVAASGEALGRVFDCLQNRDVARGLMFALMLQALRTITQ